MLVLYVKWAKSDQSFLTKWTLFLNFYMLFAWIFICRLCRDYKKVKTKISFSYQYSQAFWWTNYSVMWHCNLHPCFGDRSLLHVFCLQHFISCFYLAHCFFSVAISFLLPPMYVRNGLKRLISYSWNKWKVLPFWSHNQNNSTLSPGLLG